MTQDAGEQAGYGVEDGCGGELAPGEDEVADGELLVREELRDALIDAFVAAADEDDAVERGEMAGDGLREALALCGEQNDGFAGGGWIGKAGGPGCDVEGFDALEDRLRFEDHAFAAAEGTVVDGAVTVVGPVAKVVGVDLGDAGAQGAFEHAVVERAFEESGEEGDEVESHDADSQFQG